jgi:hypothetical protein
MKKTLAFAALTALLTAGLGQQVDAATMTFNGLTTTAITPTSHSENGLTMMAVSPAPPPQPLVDFPHFDVFGNGTLTGTFPDNVAAIHTGNLGEKVSFSYSTGAFELLSIDITGWIVGPNDPTGGTPATFRSSSGAIHTVPMNTTGIIDFASMTGWSNITSFTFEMPLLAGALSFTCRSDNCTSVGFDDVTFRAAEAVPLPAALPLFAAGLCALGLLARRRKSRPV